MHPNVISNIKEMCKDRGYHILCERENEIITNSCYIIFTNDIKININYIKDITHMMIEQQIDHIIIVYNGNITINNHNLKEITSIYNIEFFHEKLFMFNITKHELVPKHEKLSKTDPHYKMIYKEKTNLPYILEHDPICKYYNFKNGDILKVTRHNNTIAYRLVV
jgi:DNA-directed RNA polymerase I, II, and III subunit RPABC1